MSTLTAGWQNIGYRLVAPVLYPAVIYSPELTEFEEVTEDI